MNITIQTCNYEDALRWALEKGYLLATDTCAGYTLEIQELLEMAQEEREIDSNDWIIVGNILCRASNIWHDVDLEIYVLE